MVYFLQAVFFCEEEKWRNLLKAPSRKKIACYTEKHLFKLFTCKINFFLLAGYKVDFIAPYKGKKKFIL